MMNEIEIAMKERLEALDVADNVVLDFNEKIVGDSVIIFSLKSLRSLDPILNGDLYRAMMEGHITGVWKVKDGRVTPAVESRNRALETILGEFMKKNKVGAAYVRVKSFDKDIRQDIVDDMRFYVLFDVTLEIEVNVR